MFINYKIKKQLIYKQVDEQDLLVVLRSMEKETFKNTQVWTHGCQIGYFS